MSIANAIKVGVATVIGIKLAVNSYTYCRNSNRYKKKMDYLMSKDIPFTDIIFKSEEQLDILMEQV